MLSASVYGVEETAMDMSLFLQAVVNGVLLGVFYALIALGFSLIFGVMRVINFAHGQMYVIGAFIAYYFIARFHLNYFLVLFLAVCVTGVFGAVFERLIFRPLQGRELPAFIASLGLAWVLEMSTAIAFGPLDKSLPSYFDGIISVFGATFTTQRLMTVVIGVALVVALYLFLSLSRTGKAIRAVAQDREGATLQGIKADRMVTITFAIGCALAGASGVLMTPSFTVNPFVGSEIMVKTFTVIILGGVGSIPGALVGGLVLGFFESFACLVFRVCTVNVLSFAFIIFILLMRPQGLLGRDEHKTG